MKRLLPLAILLILVSGMTTTTFASDIKATGAYTFEAVCGENDLTYSFLRSRFDVYQRLRTKFEFIANENLKGVLYTEVGTNAWGWDMKAGYDIFDVVTIKAGYIDFNWPGTQQNVKMGHLRVTLPGAVGGSIVLDDELPTVLFSGPINDNISYMLGWHRVEKSGWQGGTADEADAISASLPIKFDGFTVTPFVLALYAGHNFDYDVDDITWSGMSVELTLFDPFVFRADINYGEADYQRDDSAAGWFTAMSAEYTGFDFMTPEAFFVWSSGDDKDTTYAGEDQMPYFLGDWAVGSFWFGGDWGIGDQSSINADVYWYGFWTLGVSLKDISFFEKLTHTVNVLYIQGTNAEEFAAYAPSTYLTEGDSLWEFDLNSAYSIYDELTAYVELGLITPDWSDDRNRANQEAWKISTGLNYAF
ncbi:outer membrane homotrimeric porin [Pseudodesulfovibrio senegalensis]|uniref:Outer membrane homotrimeric porin n=1 Tax=Pseudodesulfovibrio senegalensis TaxID=1721087 RepID=A0A6N6N7S4_9BACT|nr:outer membrane homotrimeric porin [Pseudodesulfovibrio senegalensis]KAB1443445.1 hypothetical protein F8A88_04115 [Pseudodesulfovibrio senegalensis]